MNIRPQSPQHVTPPESFTSRPLTPPSTVEKTTSSVSQIIRKIRNKQQGRDFTDIPWDDYVLDLEGYQDLLQQLQSDESLWLFWQHNLRYDYFPSTNRFVFRMLTSLHECFIYQIVKEIQGQLDAIEGQSAQFAENIQYLGSATLTFPDQNYGKHDPDGQFGHLKAQYPGVVMEISYSQKRKDLPRLADDYILGSDGDIRAVVGLDIEYRASKEATLSVWRPNVETNEDGEKELVAQQIITNQVFRDGNGKPNISRTGGLQLRLRDFTTETLAEPEGRLCEPITISANTLCSFLELAEERFSLVKQHAGVVRPTKPWVRKRAREVTPPEELKHEDEQRFQANENKAAEQAIKDDSSYKTSSASEAEGS